MTDRMDGKNEICVQRYHAPCGDLLLGSFDGRLCLCNWVVEKHPGRVDRRLQGLLKAVYVEKPSGVVQEAAAQLDEYFRCGRTAFSVPLLLAGTGFKSRYGNSWRTFLTGRRCPTGNWPGNWDGLQLCAPWPMPTGPMHCPSSCLATG